MRLRDLFSDRDRLELHYREDSISLNPVLRQPIILTPFSSTRAVDPHSFFADPDPAVLLNADPDPAA